MVHRVFVMIELRPSVWRPRESGKIALQLFNFRGDFHEQNKDSAKKFDT